jgi:hypothetical protein
MAWQPIETAPRDGTEILAYNAFAGRYLTRFVDGEWPKYGWDNMTGVWYPRPTHWMPLPPPPSDV